MSAKSSPSALLHLRFHHMRSQLRQTSGLVTEHGSSNFGMACHGMSWHVTISPCKFSDVFPFQAHVQCAGLFWFGEMCRCRAPKPTAFELGALKVLASSLPCKSCRWNGDNMWQSNKNQQWHSNDTKVPFISHSMTMYDTWYEKLAKQKSRSNVVPMCSLCFNRKFWPVSHLSHLLGR